MLLVGKAEAMGPYANDERTGAMRTHTTKDEGDRRHRTSFCQSFYPPLASDGEKQALELRIRYRMEQLQVGM